MRILLDECVHAGVRAAFPNHSVRTVTEAGWKGRKDGDLLAYAEQSFDVFVTIDRQLERERDLPSFRLGFVIARVRSNILSSYRAIFEELRSAAERVKPGEVIHINATNRR